MALAWLKLNTAICLMAGPGCQRARLFSAYVPALADLKKKELPGEVQHVFERVVFQLSSGNSNRVADEKEVKAIIEAMDDLEIAAVVADLIQLHDAVMHYQPLSKTELEQVHCLYRDCVAA